MPSIGPELPPHLLAKRKRVAEEEAEPVAARKPLPDTTRFSSPGGEQSTEKRRRIAGPTLPPAPLDELPPSTPPSGEAPEEDDWSDNDEYGPAVPTSEAVAPPRTDLNLSTDDSPPNPNDATKVKRDEWMTLPPTADGLSSRLDPTKPRARKFNTGKGARGPNHANGSDNAVWTETPEQKRRRLEDEVMGVVRPAAASGKDTKTQLPSVKDGEIARRIREHDVSIHYPSAARN